MKDSKKRDHPKAKKRKHGRSAVNLESWDQSDLEDADEKVLEKRLHQLKLQLQMAQDEGAHGSQHSSNKHNKRVCEELVSTETDSSNSDSSLSSNSSISTSKYKFKKSSTDSDDNKGKCRHGSLSKKKYKYSRDSSRGERENTLSAKFDKKSAYKKKVSLVSDKYSRRKSPLIDKREVYSRIDTGRWHEKAKEFGKEHKFEVAHEKPRTRSHKEVNWSSSRGRVQRTTVRDKEDRTSNKLVARGSAASSARRKESPEPSKRARVSYDSLRRITTITRKMSPRDERTTRYDNRRVDLKVTRRNPIRADVRDVNLRITRDVREHKDTLSKAPGRIREREVTNKSHRDTIELGCVESRDRSRGNEESFKERGKRVHDRLELERNARNQHRHDSRDSIDEKFRRNERPADANRGGGVFDRMRSRYNDRRNAENCQLLGKDRLQVDEKKDRQLDKDLSKLKSNDMNGTNKLARDRRPTMTPVRTKSPLHRERKDAERLPEKRSRSPINVDRRFSNPLDVRRIRESETRLNVKRKSTENDDPLWNKKKSLNKTRSQSRSSEGRRRRRSSQEEWRVIDMTSPVLDDDFSDDNSNSLESDAQNKTKKSVTTPGLHSCKRDGFDDSCGTKQNKSMLTGELSDISDEDFNEVNANFHHLKNIKDIISKIKPVLNSDKIVRNRDQNDMSDREDSKDNKTVCTDTNDATDHVDGIITDRKLQPEGGTRIDLVKEAEDIDSEEDTVSRVSDALGVNWADLVEESKRTPNLEDASFDIRRRWSTNYIFASIGISEEYAGEELFNQIEKDISTNESGEDDNASETLIGKKTEKFWHKVACLHLSLKSKAVQRRTLFEPYKTAISARKDIAIRRKLCGLPVKNLCTQQMIGIYHWIV